MKKKMCILLTLCLLLSALAGCQNGGKEISENQSTNQAAQSGAGGWQETEVKLPDEFIDKGETFISLLNVNQTTLELYGATKDSVGQLSFTKYILQDGTWDSQQPVWLNELETSGYLNNMIITIDEDGTRYALYQGLNELYGIVKTVDEQSGTQVAIEDWSVGGDKAGVRPVDLQVASDGTIIANIAGTVCLYDCDTGKRIEELTMVTADSIYSRGDCLWILSNQAKTITQYLISDTSDYEVVKRSETTEGQAGLFAIEDEKIYVLDENGLSAIAAGGTIWERLLENSGSTASDPSYTCRQFFRSEENIFYAAFTSNSGCRIMKYSRDEKENQSNGESNLGADGIGTPTKELTIYALENNKTIQNAISNFKTSHPEVTVNFIVGTSEEGATSTSDIIRALNTEVFAGNGADILILDGLPLDTYVEKGVLADISDVIEECQTELLPNVVSAYNKDGACYMIPARIGIPLVMGLEDVVNKGESIKSLADYAGSASLPYFLSASYESLVETFYPLLAEELYDDNGNLNKEALIDFLESLEIIADTFGAEEFTVIEGGYLLDIGTNKTSLAIDTIKGIGSIEAMEKIGAVASAGGTYATINDSFAPYTLLGINQSSGNQELAKEFIREVLSTKVQENDFFDGFPVSLSALDIWEAWEDTIDQSIMASDEEGNLFMVKWLSAEERTELINTLKSLKTPLASDEVILEMILAESVKFLKGEENAETAAEKIINSARLYLAE